jgi:hypothetical protein
MSIENGQEPGRDPDALKGRPSEMDPSGEFRAALGRSRIAGIAFFVELLILFGMVAFLDRRVRLRIPLQERSAIQTVRIALFAAAAASVLAARLINGRMLEGARKAAGDRSRLGLLNRTALVSLSLSMIPAVIGFFLYLLAGQTRDFTLLAFASLLLLFFYFPRPAAWETILADKMPVCRL